jgi:hypothetical protein
MSMHQELIQHLREHALALVNIARKLSDPDISAKLEAMAVELLRRASTLEHDTHF